MTNFAFTKFIPPPNGNTFEELLKLFLQLLQYTNGDIAETLEWMNQIDQQYRITNNGYGMGDFIEELKNKGYLEENPVTGVFNPGARANKEIRKQALEEIFGKLKRTPQGNHKTTNTGRGDEVSSETRKYAFGDHSDQIDLTTSIQNAQINHGIDCFFSRKKI